jgi:hypothetical protein
MKSIVALSAMPYAQAKVYCFVDGATTLISYATPVAHIDTEGWLEVYGLYSQTTRKHIGAFVKEYAGLTYQTAKQLYTDGYKMNIHTGEVVEVN